MQKPIDAVARRELDDIYSGYAMYLQAGGNEQRALDAASGVLDPRSQQILRRFLAEVELGSTGRWLDIGCGNGGTLRAVSSLLPHWRSVGSELDDRNRAVVESIPGVDSLHAGSLADLDDAFDVISMVHVLEHVDDPVGFLGSLARLARPGCVIFVELPYSLGNCFDLAIADHVTHFDERTLRECFTRAGLAYGGSGRNFLDRELFMIGRFGSVEVSTASVDDFVLERGRSVVAQVEWLKYVGDAVRAFDGPVAIFGSSIGATYAFAARDGDVGAFVDEDPDRIGRSHLGVPIVGPADVSPETQVYVALPPQLAAKVTAKGGRDRWVMPPPYESALRVEALA